MVLIVLGLASDVRVTVAASFSDVIGTEVLIKRGTKFGAS